MCALYHDPGERAAVYYSNAEITRTGYTTAHIHLNLQLFLADFPHADSLIGSFSPSQTPLCHIQWMNLQYVQLRQTEALTTPEATLTRNSSNPEHHLQQTEAYS